VDRANEWLQTNVGICQVKTCETVTWCAVNPQSLGDSEQMSLSTGIAPGSKTFHLRGFRSEDSLHWICHFVVQHDVVQQAVHSKLYNSLQ